MRCFLQHLGELHSSELPRQLNTPSSPSFFFSFSLLPLRDLLDRPEPRLCCRHHPGDVQLHQRWSNLPEASRSIEGVDTFLMFSLLVLITTTTTSDSLRVCSVSSLRLVFLFCGASLYVVIHEGAQLFGCRSPVFDFSVHNCYFEIPLNCCWHQCDSLSWQAKLLHSLLITLISTRDSLRDVTATFVSPVESDFLVSPNPDSLSAR